MWQQINLFWMQLATREQRMLGLLGVFGVAVLFYALLWQPLQQQHSAAQQALLSAKAQWEWLSGEVQAHPRQTDAAARLEVKTASQLIAHLQKSLREAGLQPFMETMTPNQKGVSVRFARVPAPALTRWLSQLEEYGLVSHQLRLVTLGSGLVEAMVQFEVAN